jgi:mandelate racemase
MTPTAHWLEYVDWANPILCERLEIRQGQAVIPDRPGHGIRRAEDAVARFLVQ